MLEILMFLRAAAEGSALDSEGLYLKAGLAVLYDARDALHDRYLLLAHIATVPLLARSLFDGEPLLRSLEFLDHVA